MHIIIVGAGLSGLSAAFHLEKQGHHTTIIEASDRPGGRIKTDVVDGFRMDRGFQVLLTAYPEAKAMFDYDALDLKRFVPGARILHTKGTATIGDPLRQFSSLFPTLFAPVGSIGDKLKMLSLKNELTASSIESIFNRKETTTAERLGHFGFSPKMINSFFKPFFGGIFLENDLSTSSRMFDFVFKMFSEGHAAIPAKGMEELPKQIISKLKNSKIICNERVSAVAERKILTESGETIAGDIVLIATESNNLVQQAAPKVKKAFVSTTNIYFSTDTAPMKNAIIALNASGKGSINNCCVISNTSPDYAPKGKHLISLSINDYQENPDIEAIKKELSTWMNTTSWNFLKSYPIRYALPQQNSVQYQPDIDAMKVNEQLYVCGDHQSNGSINAALLNGKVVANLLQTSIKNA